MVKQITITGICDGGHEGPVVTSIEHTLSLDGSKPVAVDVCEECEDLFVRLRKMMENGTEVPVRSQRSKPSRRPSPSTCPECGHVSPNRSALGQHCRQHHGKGLRDYSEEDWARVS